MVFQSYPKLINARVLVVEDQAEIRALLCSALRHLGVGVVKEARDGGAAMEAIVNGDVTMVVCDWNMPNMNGIDFLKHVRKTRPDLPFLMMTARSDKESLIAAKEAGVNAFLRKPFTPAQLEAKVSNLVEGAPV